MSRPLIAVDIGNSRLKLGWFDAVDAPPSQLSEPRRQIAWAHTDWHPQAVLDWLGDVAPNEVSWAIASVNHPAATRLAEWLASQAAPHCELGLSDMPLTVDIPVPEQAGIDRLVAAVAVNVLRSTERPAIVVSLGTATTVDLITAGGVLIGGAILPGIAMSARALAQQTDQLPQVNLKQHDTPPPVLGRDTETNIASGLYWGTVGAVRELIAQFSNDLSQPPDVFLTGGAAPIISTSLDATVHHVPHLVLGGIAVVHRAGSIGS